MKYTILKIILGFLLCPTSIFGQVASGQISGTVKDITGGIVPGAAVEATNVDTGLKETGITDNEGRFRLVGTIVGFYRVSASLPGFKTAIRSGIDLTVGREAVLNFVLEPGLLEESVEVVGEASPVNTTSGAVAHLVDNAQVHSLPLNGRDLAQLATLQPGVVSAPASDGSRRALSMGGARPSQNSFLLDGADINDQRNWTPGSAAGNLLGVEILREFEVITNNYSSEFGRSPGGIVNAVTRSGSNRFEATLFAFHRNDNLDATNFITNRSGLEKPEFKRNQFGAVVGGPIIRNRTFFLASYEGLREGLGLTQAATVPTEQARQGNLPGQPPFQVDLAVEPYLQLYPLPNGSDFEDGTAEFSSTSTQVTEEDFFFFRIDHQISEKNHLFFRYYFDDASRASPDSLQFVETLNDSRNQYFTIEEKWTASTRLLNTLRFSFNRSRDGRDFLGLEVVPEALSFVPGRPLGQTSISGMTGFGPSRFGPSRAALNLFEVNEGAAYSAGRHSIKFGLDVKRLQNNNETAQSLWGFYQFRSLRDFLTNSANSVELPFPETDAIRGWRQWMWGFYLQDDIRWRPNFTWNLGLRYEFITVPQEVNGKVANLRDPLRDAQTTVGNPFFENPSLQNFTPRVGFAWDPFGEGKTSVRAGFGIFFEQVWTDAYRNPGSRQSPFFTLTRVPNPIFPNEFDFVDFDTVQGSGRVDTIQFDLDNPYRLHYSLNLQHEFLPQTVLSIGYIGARDITLLRLLDFNTAIPEILLDGRKFFAEGLSPRNPAFGGIRHKSSDGNSFYHSLQIGVRRRFQDGLSIQSSYTFSKSIDEGSIVTTQGGEFANGDITQDPDDRLSERALSSFDIRHNWVLNVTYSLPFGVGLSGAAEKLLSGWQINGILSIASGSPFSAVLGFDRARSLPQSGGGGQRPNLVSGQSNNPVVGATTGCTGVMAGQELGTPDRYFDPCAFELQDPGFFGDLGRNTMIGPGLANLDFSLVKDLVVAEDIRLQFRIESFNLFNHPNFAIPGQRTVFTRGAVRVGSAGRVTRTSTPGRQMQFGLKFSF